MQITDFARERVTIASDGTVEGYASLFGEIDQARDMVMPGAFAETLRKRGVRRVPMLFQHDPAEPVGVWLELREDARGLYARGRLIPEVARGRELYALLKAGTSDGLSIGFRTVKGRVDPKTRIRKLEAIDLWEISIVTFPLLPGARITTVKEAGSPSRLAPSATPVPASAAGGRRDIFREKAPAARVALSRAPARKLWPLRSGVSDLSARTFKPERFYRRHPRFQFDGGERLGCRDLVLPERQLGR
jgi:HK97 family phage prohead protease